jgi:hypothetical protein
MIETAERRIKQGLYFEWMNTLESTDGDITVHAQEGKYVSGFRAAKDYTTITSAKKNQFFCPKRCAQPECLFPRKSIRSNPIKSRGYLIQTYRLFK